MPASPPLARAPRSSFRGLSRALGVFLVFFGLPWVLLHFDVEAPFVWVFLLGGITFVVWGIRRRGVGGIVLFNLGVVLLVLTGFEAYRWRRSLGRPRYVRAEGEPLVRKDPRLGYVPRANASTRNRLVRGEDVLFDVSVHHGPDGLRVGPMPPTEAAVGAVLCLGGSFMYGYGLEDEQTLPCRLGERLRPERIRVYDFAFAGWGPHQMLAGLEGDWLDRVREPVKVVIYLCIPDHVRRVRGSSTWDRRGPRYRLLPDGGVVLDGRFSDAASTWPSRLRDLAGRSYLGERILGMIRAADTDPALLVGLVRASAASVRRRWPAATFRVLLWDQGPGWTEALGERLEATGLPVYRIGKVLPGLFERADLRIPGDSHPSAATAERLARYAAEVLAEPAIR